MSTSTLEYFIFMSVCFFKPKRYDVNVIVKAQLESLWPWQYFLLSKVKVEKQSYCLFRPPSLQSVFAPLEFIVLV
jgi:hypothetical protein